MAAGLLRADPADGFGPGAPAGKAAHISWHAGGHLIAAGIGFIALIAACFVIARYFSRPGRRGMAVYSRITGLVFLAGFTGVTTGSASSAIVLPFYAAVPRRLRLARRRRSQPVPPHRLRSLEQTRTGETSRCVT